MTEPTDALMPCPFCGGDARHDPRLRAAMIGEPVFAFRRKGLDDFCTCTEERYEELSTKPNLFETRIFYTTPQPTQPQAGAVPLTDEQIARIYERYGGDMINCTRSIERHHGIKGGQHGTDN